MPIKQESKHYYDESNLNEQKYIGLYSIIIGLNRSKLT
jgi:hypothetical protein